MAFEYIDHSIEVMQSLDIERLSRTRPGQLIGSTGDFVIFRSLEELSTADGLAIGLKLPRPQKRMYIYNRLKTEMANISLFTGAVPELRYKAPYFMGQLLVENEVVALITRDVTDSGRKSIKSMPVSRRVREQLAPAFCSNGESLYDVLSREELENELAFEVDGAEWLLDFDGFPVRYECQEAAGLYDHGAYCAEKLGQLSIFLSANSPLAKALRASEELDEVISFGESVT